MSGPTTPPRELDDLPVRVETGTGLVIRLPGIVAVVDPTAVPRPGAVNELLETLRVVSGTAGAAAGAELARELEVWVSGPDAAPSFGAVTAGETGLALFLRGDATGWVDGEQQPGGKGGAGPVVVGWPRETLRITLGGPAPAEPAVELPDWAGLYLGVTGGAGFSLRVSRSAAGPDTSRPGIDLPGPVLSERIDGGAPEPAREPLPIEGRQPPRSHRERHQEALEHAADRPGAYVRGFRCSRGHLNDPRVSFCGVCGIRMDQVTGVLVFERRPPLGLLVLDAGTTFVLDDNYVIGRNPEVSDDVRSGTHRPIRIDDRSGSLSRAHSEIRLVDWDVLIVDRGSINGTYVAGPEAAGQPAGPRWSRLAPNQPFVLTPGTHVLIGSRRFVFESSSARL